MIANQDLQAKAQMYQDMAGKDAAAEMLDAMDRNREHMALVINDNLDYEYLTPYVFTIGNAWANLIEQVVTQGHVVFTPAEFDHLKKQVAWVNEMYYYLVQTLYYRGFVHGQEEHQCRCMNT